MSHLSLTREIILNELRTLKPVLAEKFGVSRMGLFGSFARNEGRADSDVDVVIEMTKPDMFAMVHVKTVLENDFHRPVDLVRYRDKMNAFLKKRIEREALYV